MWNRIKNHDDLPFMIVWTIVLILTVVVVCMDLAAAATVSNDAYSGGQSAELWNAVF